MPKEDRLQRMVMLARIRKDMEARWRYTNLHPSNQITTLLAYDPERKHKLYSASELDMVVGNTTFLGWGRLGVQGMLECVNVLRACMHDPIIAECIAIFQMNETTHYALHSPSGITFGISPTKIDLAVSDDSCNYIFHALEQGIEIFNSLTTVK